MKIIFSLLFFWLFFASFAFAQIDIKNEDFLRTRALKINVDDMKKALAFYVEKLGFEVEDRSNYPKEVILKTNDRVKLILFKVKKLRATDELDTRVSFTLQVNDLDEAIERMKKTRVEIAESERRREGVGFAIFIRDPFGRKISLMHQTIVKVEPFKEPKIYNFGFYLPDMNVARDFYANKLGFVVRSERYLPLDLPLGHKDKTFGFMLHARPNARSIRNEYPKAMPQYTIVFETSDLQKAVDKMTGENVKIISKTQSKDKKLESVIFEDPFGNISEIVEAN